METKKILITGGTGFIGSYLSDELMKQGHYVVIVTRSPDKYSEEQATNQEFVSWDNLDEVMNQVNVVLNLVGENLFGRWNETVKKKIYNSRILFTRKLVDAIKKADTKPELLVSASGVSIYGDHGNQVIDESTPAADNFLGNTCSDWEAEAKRAEKFGVRVANPRLGPVLEEEGGLVSIMKLPFALFIGGPVGSGNQYVPWIHMRDVCRALLFPLHNEQISGPYNVCSPEPTKMDDFASIFGSVTNRPSFFRVPEFAVKLVLGEGAQPALESLRVQPKVLQINDFQFEFEDLQEALADIL